MHTSAPTLEPSATGRDADGEWDDRTYALAMPAAPDPRESGTPGAPEQAAQTPPRPPIAMSSS